MHVLLRMNPQAGEMAGCGEATYQTGGAAGLQPYLKVEGRGTSLPALIKAKLELNKGSSLQMFQHLSVVSFRLLNLEELSKVVGSEDLAIALTSLHVFIDDLLEHHTAYMVDEPLQDHFTVVTGTYAAATAWMLLVRCS